MPDVDGDVSRLLVALDLGRQAWISGQLEWTATSGYSQAEDMTIFGPFGGEAAPGDPARQARVAAQFLGGSGHLEVVRVIEEGDLVVVVAIERNEVVFAEGKDPQPWILRTTQVFRRDPAGHWLRLHRHADPLILRRSLPDTVALLQQPSD